jgi:VanZ family protein
MNDNLLIENAILAFLHHYPDHKWAVPYAELLTKLRALKDEQPKSPTVQKRGRPAKRQRKKEAASVATSTQAVEILET